MRIITSKRQSGADTVADFIDAGVKIWIMQVGLQTISKANPTAAMAAAVVLLGKEGYDLLTKRVNTIIIEAGEDAIIASDGTIKSNVPPGASEKK